MRKIILIILIFFCLTNCKPIKQISDYPQEFQGNIKYENSIVAKDLSESSRKYYNLFGDTQILSYASGNYLLEYPHGQEYIKALYSNSSNNYFLFYRSGKIKYFKCSSDSDKIIKITKSKDTENICGYECKSIKLDYGRFSMTYFYSEELYVSPIHFVNHKYLHYNTFFEESKSIYLKSIMEYNDMKFITTAIEVNISKVNHDIFSEPSNVEKF